MADHAEHVTPGLLGAPQPGDLLQERPDADDPAGHADRIPGDDEGPLPLAWNPGRRGHGALDEGNPPVHHLLEVADQVVARHRR